MCFQYVVSGVFVVLITFTYMVKVVSPQDRGLADKSVFYEAFVNEGRDRIHSMVRMGSVLQVLFHTLLRHHWEHMVQDRPRCCWSVSYRGT